MDNLIANDLPNGMKTPKRSKIQPKITLKVLKDISIDFQETY